MFSKKFRKKQQVSSTGFRYRGMQSSRLEYLTDAVFAFSITLLVIASEVPKTYIELQSSMYGFIGFIACILLLFGIWANHSLFFLQYGLQDTKTKVLNFLFLFVLLFYIYPLKYLFSLVGMMLLMGMVGRDTLHSEPFQMALEKTQAAALTIDQWQDLVVRFGIGLMLIYGIFALMHYNALRKKEALELNDQEVYETKFHILNYFLLMLISCSSVVYILIRGGYYAEYAGLIYLLIPLGLPFVRVAYVRKMKKKFPEAFVKNRQDQKKVKVKKKKLNSKKEPLKEKVKAKAKDLSPKQPVKKEVPPKELQEEQTEEIKKKNQISKQKSKEPEE